MVELKGKQLLVATIIELLIVGALSYAALPEAYCSLEDKTVKYVHISESHKTVTKIIPGNDGGWNVLGDRCQSGSTIGTWVPLRSDTVKQGINCNTAIVAYTDNGKYFCDKAGSDANCIKDDGLLMPFG